STPSSCHRRVLLCLQSGVGLHVVVSHHVRFTPATHSPSGRARFQRQPRRSQSWMTCQPRNVSQVRCEATMTGARSRQCPRIRVTTAASWTVSVGQCRLSSFSALQMPVQCCPRPADHARGVFGTTAFGSFLGDDGEFAVNHLRINRWSAEASALGFRCGDAGVDAFGDQFSFVLSQRAEHPEHQPARRGLRVDAVRDRLDLHLSFAQQSLDRSAWLTRHPGAPFPLHCPVRQQLVGCACMASMW
ncbi:hypothetical protein CVAR292_02772, partial [Corynebacterium variabile]